jgi:hypothetical protein
MTNFASITEYWGTLVQDLHKRLYFYWNYWLGDVFACICTYMESPKWASGTGSCWGGRAILGVDKG